MAIQIFAAILLALTIVLLFIAARSLFAKGWFVKWLRGTLGFSALVLMVLGSVLALDLLSYFKSNDGQVLATLKFSQLQEQEFEVELVDVSGDSNIYQLWGDQWQLDVRLIHMQGLLSSKLPSYKLDRLSGRYLSLEQEKNSQRSVYGFMEDNYIDTWPWLANQKWLSMIQVKNGSAAFMPMSDGAIYEVTLSHKGLMALPVNEQARVAVESWL
jgi:hypothetical protein